MKSNLIIIEGPDGIGKSTFISFLEQYYNNKYKVKEYHNRHDNSYDYWVNEHIKTTNESYIFSRSFLSERLYADFFSRTSRLTQIEEEQLMHVYKNARIILLLPKDRKDHKERLIRRGDYNFILANIDEIIDRYKELAELYNDQIEVIYV